MSKNSEIGRKLKVFAKENYGSVTKLAELLDMSQPHLSNYIRGSVKPGSELLSKLSKLGCDVNWLLDNPTSDNIVSDSHNKYGNITNTNNTGDDLLNISGRVDKLLVGGENNPCKEYIIEIHRLQTLVERLTVVIENLSKEKKA